MNKRVARRTRFLREERREVRVVMLVAETERNRDRATELATTSSKALIPRE